MRVTVGSRTDVGRVRQGNEDALLVHEPLYGVADGMGGHLAGDVASATAVDVIERRAGNGDGLDGTSLERFIKEANRTIWQKANADSRLHGMGTTCTLLMIDGATGYLAHVGDSRAYLLRDGRLGQLTEDHTLVARMVEEGRLSPEEAHHHPQRSIITRALGVEDHVDVDLSTIELRAGDRMLLCSDGLSSMLDEDAIHDVLVAEQNAQGAAERLVDAANDAGGEDNITVVVVDVEGDDGSPAPTGTGPRAAAAPAREDSTDVDIGPPVRAEAEDAEEEGDFDDAEPGDDPAPRKRGRRLLLALIVLVLLVLAGFGAARYALANSWFVGADDTGVVTIYRGIPEEVLGLTLREPLEPSGVSVDELPGYLQVTVEQGIKAESLVAARRTVSNLEDRSRESIEASGSRDAGGDD